MVVEVVFVVCVADCRNVIVSSRGVEVGGVVVVVGCLDLDLVGVDGVVVGIVRCVGGMVVVVMGRAVALAASAAPSGTREVWSEVAGIQNRSAPRPHHLPLGTNGLALARRGEATLVAGVVSDASCLLSLALGLMRLLARVAFDVRALWAAGIVPDMGMAPRWPHQPALSAACSRRSSRFSNGGTSRNRLPGDRISSCAASALCMSLPGGEWSMCPSHL